MQDINGAKERERERKIVYYSLSLLKCVEKRLKLSHSYIFKYQKKKIIIKGQM